MKHFGLILNKESEHSHKLLAKYVLCLREETLSVWSSWWKVGKSWQTGIEVAYKDLELQFPSLDSSRVFLIQED